jgi:hypothetical protein
LLFRIINFSVQDSDAPLGCVPVEILSTCRATLDMLAPAPAISALDSVQIARRLFWQTPLFHMPSIAIMTGCRTTVDLSA